MSTPHAITIGRARQGWRLERHGRGRLDFVAADGRRHDDVDVLRVFPVSAAAGPVAIVSVEGDELAWIDAPHDLDEPLRALVAQELAQREFLPVILRIESVVDGEPAEWRVITDRGPQVFAVAHADDLLRLPDRSAFVTDTHGIRYVVPDLARLDPRSRRLFDAMN